MGIKSEKIDGTKIINEVTSSNISRTEYDTKTKKLLTTFNNGMIYEYEEVPHQIYTKFRMAESQGSYFMKNIARNYKYKKVIK